MGHYSNECPGKNNKTESNNKISDNKGFSFAQCELNFTQMNGQLKPEWVLLDAQLSCDIFNNASPLHDIKLEPGTGLKLYSNGNCYIETNMTCKVSGYGKVWHHSN